MNKLLLLAGTLIGIACIAGTNIALSDDDHDKGASRAWYNSTNPGVKAVDSGLYLEECGSCHFAYQPGLLPAVSWEQVMSGLDNHFGENAELDNSTRTQIQNYLLNNAAGRINFKLSNKMISAQKGAAFPLRITEMRYFTYEHSEIPRKMVQDNPKVKSFSHCNRCHQKASQGLYDEDQVHIEGFGRWDD